MDEVIDERGHVDVSGITRLGVGKVIGLDDLLDGVNVILYVSNLLGLKIFLLFRIDTRPDDLRREIPLTHTWHFRREGGIVIIGCVDAQQVATRQFTSTGVGLPHLVDVHTILASLDGFAENVYATIVTIKCHFHHPRARSPMPHIAPKLERQWVAYRRDIVIRAKKHPVTMGRHTHQFCFHLMTILVAKFERVFLLIVAK